MDIVTTIYFQESYKTRRNIAGIFYKTPIWMCLNILDHVHRAEFFIIAYLTKLYGTSNRNLYHSVKKKIVPDEPPGICANINLRENKKNRKILISEIDFMNYFHER